MSENLSENQKSLKLGIAGLGTVGAGTVNLIARHRDRLAARTGTVIRVVAVSARDRAKDRGFDLSGLTWYDNAVDLAKDPDVDVVVELIGGSGGIAKTVCETALAGAKHVVTANKALIAVHGTALAGLAEAKNVSVGYEAAVAGGIPVIKALREGLAGNTVSRVTGILNGTCNYILTEMRRTGADFAAVLAEAQKLGYAEADPGFDVDGIDAAHKLAILASLAFGVEVNFGAVNVEGIRQISAADIQYAEDFGYRIKLLGIARRTAAGIEQTVAPTMVPVAAPIAKVDGVFNAVALDGDFVGPVLLEGRGAGAGPTASAVVADIADIAAGRIAPVFGVAAASLSASEAAPGGSHLGAYYLRLMVADKPGVMHAVTRVLSDNRISVASMRQSGRAKTVADSVPVVFTTHETNEAAISAALAGIAGLDVVTEPPVILRIEPQPEA